VNDQIPPAIYTFKYEECVTGLATKCVETFLTVTVVDPCDPPVSLGTISTPDKTYTLGDNAESFAPDQFTIDPTYCPVDYVYSIPSLANGNNPITIVENTRTFTIDYIADDSPIS